MNSTQATDGKGDYDDYSIDAFSQGINDIPASQVQSMDAARSYPKVIQGKRSDGHPTRSNLYQSSDHMQNDFSAPFNFAGQGSGAINNKSPQARSPK